MRRVAARAFARAGLLGNPSDVYDGKAIALSVRNFCAQVEIEACEKLVCEGEPDAVALLRAAFGRFPEARDDRLRLRFQSDVPRQVGLAGSSAIVVAALRALCEWFGIALHPAELAERALAAEAEDLGIVAGPMDRVIQAYEGLLFMDFRRPRGPESYRRLPTSLLPPLFIAYDPEPGESSGVAHGDVRARWLRGDPDVRAAMQVFPRLAEEGLACLTRHDVAGLQRLVDRNFDTRASIWPIRVRDFEMVRIGRARGAAVKFCGSGGAVLGVMREADEFAGIAAAYAEAGYPTLRPTVDA